MRLMLSLVAMLGAFPAHAALQLHNAERHELDNGMTVILLPDRNFPVVSVQMLYTVGARNEVTGKTGLAHFLEHMAFRATKHFPDTDVVSRIYARGGEWHGYTWTDQTTYFSTVPRDDLGLLLAIEADRMGRLELDADFIEAERGAVLSEMHMYENWPSSMLIDALLFTVFQAHPYRNNTIGWESDIDNVTHEDVVAFYRQHYQPANAVLAIVGDFDKTAVRAQIEALFGDFEKRPATPPPHTIEPVQQGERRVKVTGTTPGRRFVMGWRAPSARHPDYAAFLVLQELLAGSSGVSFLQNDWGSPAKPGSVLYGATEDITTWFPPSAQDYVFTVGGSINDSSSEATAESAIDERLALFLESAPDPARVTAAVDEVRDELVFDVQTTEDAAHQLAFFAGLDALDVLLTLPERLQSVTPDDVLRVARHYLRPERRTIAWYRPGSSADEPRAVEQVAIAIPATGTLDETPAAAPVLKRLKGGVPAIVQASDLASSVELRVVVPGNALTTGDYAANDPEPGLLSFTGRARPSEFAALASQAGAALAEATHAAANFAPASTDPETRLHEEFRALMAPWGPANGAAAAPAVVTVAGDVAPDNAFTILDKAFGKFAAAELPKIERVALPTGTRAISLGVPVAQSQLGYVVAAPGPHDDGYLATRILLYTLAHHYEGRFGKEAISRRGLAYYVDARYTSNGGPGFVTLGIGVDTHKLDALAALLAAELERLGKEPPTTAEIEEAKQHLVGRAMSAAQGNDELATELATNWLWHGDLPSVERLRERLDAVTREDVLAVIPGFVNGLTITVAP
jgi:predicted Zn-dependent peptidase